MSATRTAPKTALSPKVQAMAKRLVLQMHMVIRTARIHDPENQALLVATENLKDTVNGLWATLGRVKLQFVDDVVYLNDVRVRMDVSAQEQVTWLRQELIQRQLGGLAFSRPVDSAALRDFIVALARPAEGEAEVQTLREELDRMRDLALELLGPRSFADDQIVAEIRIDKRTFALQTYAKALVAAREAVSALRAGEDPYLVRPPIPRLVQDMIDIATERVNLVLKMLTIKGADEYTYSHAANVLLISVVVGRAMGIPRAQLVDLGAAALLADVGFDLVDDERMRSDQTLDAAARGELVRAMQRTVRTMLHERRVDEGLIRRMMVASEHHRPYIDPETGKPSGTHVFSRIVAVADAYDALTTHRPWRAAYTPDEALRVLAHEAGTRFDPVVVRLLVNVLGVYPLGTAVVLDSGELAVVYHTSSDPKMFDRPWVKILRDAKGVPVDRTIIRDLGKVSGPGSQIMGSARPEDVEGLDQSQLVLV